jgi:cyclopropane fatty-acyl-phospholipid synthase-like methyltransferase
MDALTQTRRDARATLVDLSGDAFDYGRKLAQTSGLSDKVRFVQGDVRDVHKMLDRRPDVVKMLGICEYIDDADLASIAQALSGQMSPGAAVVLNSLSPAHGTDRFFRRVFGLNMIYRTPGQLQDLLAKGGFGNFEAIPEPLGVYHVVIGRKS